MRVRRFVVGVLLAAGAVASPHSDASDAAPMSAVAIGKAATGGAATGGAATGGAATDAWRWPVNPHRVVSRYEAPPTAYSAGHRGIDLDARSGQEVRAPADGQVSFAGTVVDRALVSVQLAGGVLLSVEPVQPAVRTGAPVRAGTLLGVVSTGGHCESGCLHLGVRVHGAYVSPLLFLGGIPRAVLLPMDAGSMAQARGWAVR